MSTAASSTLVRDTRVLGLIGLGHCLSHYYQICYAPLIIMWHEEFGASFAMLGAILTCFALATGIAQMPAGMLVDRFGARAILIWGLVISGLAVGGMALAGSVPLLFALAIVAGIGNAVFHPADYAILNSSIDPKRMGKAFSLHTFSGHIGGAVAPASMVLLTALSSWRFALVMSGAVAIVVAIILLLQGHYLKDEHDGANEQTKKHSKSAFGWRENLKLMLAPQMLVLFLFFLTQSLATSGIASFSQVVNMKIQDVSLETAGTALSVFLFAQAAGILVGGVLADRTARHDLQASACFLFSALAFAALAVFVFPSVLLVTVFLVTGLIAGMIRPARDMMVRALAPKGTTGRAFAWASTGMSIGSAAAPILFGLLIDGGRPAAVYWCVAAFSLLAIGTVTSNRWIKQPALAAEQPAE